MRIVHSCLRYPPATGGVETYIEELVRHSQNIDEKRDVRVLTSKLRTHHPASELDPNLLLDDPVYVQRLHHTTTPLLAYPRLQALRYYLKHHNPDIVHGHSFWYQPADTAARFAAKHKLPFVFNPYYYENDRRGGAKWQIYKKTIGEKTFSIADVVVVISPWEQNLISKAGFQVKRFELIPPGIDTTEFSIKRSNPFPKLIPNHFSENSNIILSVSRISHGKGLDDIIDEMSTVAKKHQDVQLIIVGEDFGARSSLLKQIKKLRLQNNVHLVGKLDRDQLLGAYQHSSIFLHPSHYEAFGIVLAEASAANLPIIARNTSAIPYVCPDNKSGLLFSHSNQISSLITKLIENPNQANALGRHGKQYISQKFDSIRSADKFIQLYEELYNK